ncbi:MAG: hypothetical protein ABF641_14275, partial [Acetobacter sp.]
MAYGLAYDVPALLCWVLIAGEWLFIYVVNSYYKTVEHINSSGRDKMPSTTHDNEGYGFAAPRGRVYDSVLNVVGGTPLVA